MLTKLMAFLRSSHYRYRTALILTQLSEKQGGKV